MRDPNRIYEIISLIQAGWQKVPDMRFGQIFENLKRYIGIDDLFYIEDDRLKEMIIDYFDLEDK